MRQPSVAVLAFPLLLIACGESNSEGPPRTTASNIEHLVVVIQENISFDAYFGRYCTAVTNAGVSCTEGPACCERAPDIPPGPPATPVLLDDEQHASFDPVHFSVCHIGEINGGAMDRFVTGACGSNPNNVAYADEATVGRYWDLARQYALADRWFQPVVGASSANDMYFARAAWVFDDNTFVPDSIGSSCSFNQNKATYTDPTVGDLLADAGVDWAFYIEGYQTMIEEIGRGFCAPPDPRCPLGLPFYPCVYDPSDIPFQYYPRFRDQPAYMRDFAAFAQDVDAGTLPAVTFVKAIGFRTEHPGSGNTITAGIDFVTTLVDHVLGSPYADNTLILLTYDESGGYFDHVGPPPTSAVDGKPYGPRVPALALGRFAKRNHVSHAVLEHSSVVKFIEWNWLGQQTGQLGTRDATVNNIGSLLDAAATGVAVPE